MYTNCSQIVMTATNIIEIHETTLTAWMHKYTNTNTYHYSKTADITDMHWQPIEKWLMFTWNVCKYKLPHHQTKGKFQKLKWKYKTNEYTHTNKYRKTQKHIDKSYLWRLSMFNEVPEAFLVTTNAASTKDLWGIFLCVTQMTILMIMIMSMKMKMMTLTMLRRWW